MKERQRIAPLDALKLFGIFLVLWGHSLQALEPDSFAGRRLFTVIYSFHMPLFMLLTGFFSASLLSGSLGEVALRRGRQLLVPALIFGSYYMLSGWLEGGVSGLCAVLANNLWYLKSAFACTVLAWIALRATPSPVAGVAVTLILSQGIMLWNIDAVYPFFLLGIFVRRHMDIIEPRCGAIALTAGLLFTIALIFYDENVRVISGRFDALRSGDFVRMLETGGRIAFKHATAAAGSIFFFSLFLWLGRNIPATVSGKALCTLGAETLGIYILQQFILEDYLGSRLAGYSFSPFVHNFLISPAIAAGVLLACVLLIRCLRQSPRLSGLLLGKS